VRPRGRIVSIQVGALDAVSLEEDIATYLGVRA